MPEESSVAVSESQFEAGSSSLKNDHLERRIDLTVLKIPQCGFHLNI